MAISRLKHFGKHISFLKSLLLHGEVSFISKNSKDEFVIETKLYLDGDIICNIFSENEEEVIAHHLVKVKKQIGMLRHLSKYITALFTSISTVFGYVLQMESNLPYYERIAIVATSIISPYLLKKPLFKGTMGAFTFISKAFMSKGSLKRFTS